MQKKKKYIKEIHSLPTPITLFQKSKVDDPIALYCELMMLMTSDSPQIEMEQNQYALPNQPAQIERKT